jgi:hypothetical protein
MSAIAPPSPPIQHAYVICLPHASRPEKYAFSIVDDKVVKVWKTFISITRSNFGYCFEDRKEIQIPIPSLEVGKTYRLSRLDQAVNEEIVNSFDITLLTVPGKQVQVKLDRRQGLLKIVNITDDVSQQPSDAPAISIETEFPVLKYITNEPSFEIFPPNNLDKNQYGIIPSADFSKAPDRAVTLDCCRLALAIGKDEKHHFSVLANGTVITDDDYEYPCIEVFLRKVLPDHVTRHVVLKSF